MWPTGARRATRPLWRSPYESRNSWSGASCLGDYTVVIHPFESHPIVKQLGLQAAPREAWWPDNSTTHFHRHLQFSFTMEKGARAMGVGER